ncbi:unnamed protein product [Dimorphilus gyrociliatus]|uniref:Uncharacterized protein n=1 Tax=Dimorphilus gyrociliatus TaxID=2664684 RepID=A0A7I8VBH5_9ANNE|nr:unnamed protein product [Dimorphilus gyrociliatus]
MTRGLLSENLENLDNLNFKEGSINRIERNCTNLSQDEDGDSPLHLSIYFHNDKTCCRLIPSISKQSLNLQNNLGQTGLHIATVLNKVNVVKELISNGIEQVLVDCNGKTAFHIACSMNNIDLVKSLSGKHFNKSLLQIRDFQGDTILHSALRSKIRKEILLYLITELGADVNMIDSRSGRNIFHILAEEGDVMLFRLLHSLSKCANFSLLTFSGHSIYQLAIGWEKEEIADYLIKIGADDEPYQSTDDEYESESDDNLDNFINMSTRKN